MKRLILLLSVLGMLSCTRNENMERTFQRAGENRAKLYAEHPDVFPKENLEWAARMVLEKAAKVESSAIRQMREEVKIMLEEKE